MKKVFLFTIFALSFSLSSVAQAFEGSLTYDKKKQPAVIIDYSLPEQAVKNALIQRFARAGYKPKEEKGMFNKDKGMLIFQNAFVTDISSSSLDYIVSIEKKSRKNDDQSTLSMIMMKNGENAMPLMDGDDVARVKSYLNYLTPDIEDAKLELDIKAQEETVTKAEKKFKDLRDDQTSMEKKIRELENDLKKNAENQEKQQKEIESQKQALDLLRGRRRI